LQRLGIAAQPLDLQLELRNRDLKPPGARQSDECRDRHADDGGQQAEPEQNQEPFHGEPPSTRPILL
jgi:hypothetical protein